MLSNDVIHVEFDSLMSTARYKYGEMAVATLTESVYNFFGLFCEMVREEEKREPLGNMAWWIGGAVVAFRRWHAAEIELEKMRKMWGSASQGEA